MGVFSYLYLFNTFEWPTENVNFWTLIWSIKSKMKQSLTQNSIETFSTSTSTGIFFFSFNSSIAKSNETYLTTYTLMYACLSINLILFFVYTLFTQKLLYETFISIYLFIENAKKKIHLNELTFLKFFWKTTNINNIYCRDV